MQRTCERHMKTIRASFVKGIFFELASGETADISVSVFLPAGTNSDHRVPEHAVVLTSRAYPSCAVHFSTIHERESWTPPHALAFVRILLALSSSSRRPPPKPKPPVREALEFPCQILIAASTTAQATTAL